MSDEETKTEKPVKTPGVFKKPIKKETFERKYVKNIEHPQDRDFFISCFQEQDDTYIIRESLTKDDVKKLKLLLKVIRENKKWAVKVVPLVIAAAVVTVIVFFFAVLANPLLEHALEMGLETIFEAKADVDNFHISVFRFRISIGGITVANRDRPMTNLFQLGKTEIRLRPQAVLRGKIYIEEIRADTIRFGTARSVSGALPDRPPKVKPERPKNDAPPLVDLRNFDAMALLNQEFDKLSTPRIYDEAISAYNETVTRWRGQVEGARGRVAEVRAASTPIMNINVSSIRDLDEVRRTIQDVNNALTTVRSAANDAANMVRGLESDINTATQLERNARNAITDDISHLRSYIDLGSGAAFGALEPFIRDILSDTAEQYFDYGLRALEALEKIKEMADAQPKNEKPPKQPKVVFRGRDVHFPSVSYPSFFLGVLASDFTIDSWNWSFDLRNISSSPDLTGRPATLALGLSETGGRLARKVAFNGSADFRTNPQERFNAAVTGSGFPLSIRNQLRAVGINGFAGETAFSLNLSGRTDGVFSAGGDVNISQAQLIDPTGTIAEAIDTAVREASAVNLGIQYTHRRSGKDDFNITTNIADLMARALRNAVEVYARRAMEQIERILRQKINDYIEGRFGSRDELDLLLRTARGDSAAIDQFRSAVDNKRNELEQRVRDEASQQAGRAVQNIRGLFGR